MMLSCRAHTCYRPSQAFFAFFNIILLLLLLIASLNFAFSWQVPLTTRSLATRRPFNQHHQTTSISTIITMTASPPDKHSNDDNTSIAKDDNNLVVVNDDGGDDDLVEKEGIPLFDTNEYRGATLFGLEPKEMSDVGNNPLGDGMQYTSIVILLISCYVTLSLFFADV